MNTKRFLSSVAAGAMVFLSVVHNSAPLCYAQCNGVGCHTFGYQYQQPAPVYYQPAPAPQPQQYQQQPTPEVVKQASRNICMISNRGSGEGSGVYVGRGYVLTCNHTFLSMQQTREVNRVTVTFPDGSASEAHLVDSDATWDLAMLRLVKPPAHLTGMKFETVTPQKQMIVYACGTGRRGVLRFVFGRVLGFGSGRYGRQVRADTIIMQGAAQGGDSGGAIISSRGRLAGILWGTNGTTIVGTQVGRCWTFSRRWLIIQQQQPQAPLQPQTQPESVLQPPQPDQPTPADTGEVDKLRDQVELLVKEVSILRDSVGQLAGTISGIELKEGPAGPQGMRGPTGPRGLTGATPDLDIDQIAEAVKRKLSGQMKIVVEKP